MAKRKKNELLEDLGEQLKDLDQTVETDEDSIMAAFLGNSVKHKLDLLAVGAGVTGVPEVGVPLPSFCWELLLSTTVFPLGRLFVLGAPYGAGKSTLSFEMIRWFGHAGGKGLLIDNESKFLADVATSIFMKEFDEPPMVPVTTKSFGEASRVIIEGLKNLKAYALKKDKKGELNGFTWPLLEVLDSITGSDTDKDSDKIISAGCVEDKSFASVPWYANKFLPVLVPYLNQFPASLLAIAHVSEKEVQGPGFTTKQFVRKGGRSWNYHAIGTFLLSKITNKAGYYEQAPNEKVPGFKAQYYNLKMTKGKNENTILPYWVRWFEVPFVDSNGLQQAGCITKFAWHEATMTMLRAPADCHLSKTAQACIRDLLDVKEASGPTDTRLSSLYYSKALGIDKSSPVTPKEFVSTLYANTELLSQLRAGCGISEGIPFIVGCNYDELVKQARVKARSDLECRRTVNFDSSWE